MPLGLDWCVSNEQLARAPVVLAVLHPRAPVVLAVLYALSPELQTHIPDTIKVGMTRDRHAAYPNV